VRDKDTSEKGFARNILLTCYVLQTLDDFGLIDKMVECNIPLDQMKKFLLMVKELETNMNNFKNKLPPEYFLKVDEELDILNHLYLI